MRLRHTVFISYSKDAADFARTLASRLDSAGYQTILDNWDLNPGSAYDRDLETQVKSCSLFLFVVSARSVLPDAYALTELGWAAKSRRRILGAFAPGHFEVTPPPELAARTLSRRGGDQVANTVSEVRGVLGRPGAPVAKISAAAAALVLLAVIVLAFRGAKPPTPGENVVAPPIAQPQSSTPPPSATPTTSPSSPTRERVNKPSEFASVFTRLRGAILGFGLTEADIFGTRWTAETTTQDPSLSFDDSKGLFQFYRQNPCYGACGAADIKLEIAAGASTTRNLCDLFVFDSSLDIECPNLQNMIARATFDLQWTGRQFIGTETVYCGQLTGAPRCPQTGVYVSDVRLTRLN